MLVDIDVIKESINLLIPNREVFYELFFNNLLFFDVDPKNLFNEKTISENKNFVYRFFDEVSQNVNNLLQLRGLCDEVARVYIKEDITSEQREIIRNAFEKSLEDYFEELWNDEYKSNWAVILDIFKAGVSSELTRPSISEDIQTVQEVKEIFSEEIDENPLLEDEIVVPEEVTREEEIEEEIQPDNENTVLELNLSEDDHMDLLSGINSQIENSDRPLRDELDRTEHQSEADDTIDMLRDEKAEKEDEESSNEEIFISEKQVKLPMKNIESELLDETMKHVKEGVFNKSPPIEDELSDQSFESDIAGQITENVTFIRTYVRKIIKKIIREEISKELRKIEAELKKAS
ncbi:MAG: globin [Halobacteriovoraceae bacterium]|nr:globin [Halobacteriovoraceae bacterium]